MKKTKAAVILILFFTCLQLHAQQSNIDLTSIFGTYKWIHEVVIHPCNIEGVKDTDSAGVTSLPGQLFRVINIGTNGYVIKILNYDTSKPENDNYVNIFNQTNYTETKRTASTKKNVQKYFLITAEMLLAAASKIEKEKPSLVAGVMSLPFKFRLKDGDFNGNFNIGAAGGWRFGHYTSKPAISALVAASVSTINLDTATVTKNKLDILGTNSLSAFTFSFGAMIEFGKVQAGVFIGFDWLSRLNNQKFGWVYQGRPWISFGIGYSLFGSEKKDSDGATTNPDPKK